MANIGNNKPTEAQLRMSSPNVTYITKTPTGTLKTSTTPSKQEITNDIQKLNNTYSKSINVGQSPILVNDYNSQVSSINSKINTYNSSLNQNTNTTPTQSYEPSNNTFDSSILQKKDYNVTLPGNINQPTNTGTLKDIQTPMEKQINIQQPNTYNLPNLNLISPYKIQPQGTISEIKTPTGNKVIDSPATIYYTPQPLPTVPEIINKVPEVGLNYIANLEKGTANIGLSFIDTGTSIANTISNKPNNPQFSDLYAKELQKDTGYNKDTFFFNQPGISDVYIIGALLGAGSVGSLAKAGLITEGSAKAVEFGGKLVYGEMLGVQTFETLNDPSAENIIGEGLLLTPLGLKATGIKFKPIEETKSDFKPYQKEASAPKIEYTEKEVYESYSKLKDEMNNPFLNDGTKKTTFSKDINGNEIKIEKPISKPMTDKEFIEQYTKNENAPKRQTFTKDINGNEITMEKIRREPMSDEEFITKLTKQNEINNIKNVINNVQKVPELEFDYIRQRSLKNLNRDNLGIDSIEKPESLKFFEKFDKDFEESNKLIRFDFEEGYIEDLKKQIKIKNKINSGRIKSISELSDNDLMKSNLPKDMGEKSIFPKETKFERSNLPDLGEKTNLPKNIGTKQNLPDIFGKDEEMIYKTGTIKEVPLKDTFFGKRLSIVDEALENEKVFNNLLKEELKSKNIKYELSVDGIESNKPNELSLERFKEPKPIKSKPTYDIINKYSESDLKTIESNNQKLILETEKPKPLLKDALINKNRIEAEQQGLLELNKLKSNEELIKEYESEKYKDSLKGLVQEAKNTQERMNYNKPSLVDEAIKSESNKVFEDLEQVKQKPVQAYEEPIQISELEPEFEPQQKAVSEFEGLGTYERSDMFPPIQINKQKYESYNETTFLNESESTNEAIKESNLDLLKSFQIPKQEQPQAQGQPQSYYQPFDYAQPEALAQPQAQRYKEDLKQELKEELKQEEEYKQYIYENSEKKKKLKKLNKLYIAQVRKKGKFQAISEPVSKEEAFKIGSRNVLNTLSATFRIIPTGKYGETNEGNIFINPKIFRHPKENSKIYSENTYIQKTTQEGGLKGGRLSNPYEIAEIKQSRKKDNKMFKEVYNL